jgi:hypothetical protein
MCKFLVFQKEIQSSWFNTGFYFSLFLPFTELSKLPNLQTFWEKLHLESWSYLQWIWSVQTCYESNKWCGQSQMDHWIAICAFDGVVLWTTWCGTFMNVTLAIFVSRRIVLFHVEFITVGFIFWTDRLCVTVENRSFFLWISGMDCIYCVYTFTWPVSNYYYVIDLFLKLVWRNCDEEC